MQSPAARLQEWRLKKQEATMAQALSRMISLVPTPSALNRTISGTSTNWPVGG
jgi:hypothetical protein